MIILDNMQAISSIPNHVAVVLDGNRRWAVSRGMKPWMGHAKGADKFSDFLDWCLDAGVPNVSAYVLSTENLKRSKREIKEIIKIFISKLNETMNSEKFQKYGLKVNFVGDLTKLPKTAVNLMKKMMKQTAKFTKRVLNILICYGGKYELINAFQKILNKAFKAGSIKISEKDVEKNLFVRTPVDLVIRTGGKSRLSNLMLWQTAYAEMYTTNTLWPDFSKRDFMKAIRFYNNSQKNFGL